MARGEAHKSSAPYDHNAATTFATELASVSPVFFEYTDHGEPRLHDGAPVPNRHLIGLLSSAIVKEDTTAIKRPLHSTLRTLA